MTPNSEKERQQDKLKHASAPTSERQHDISFWVATDASIVVIRLNVDDVVWIANSKISRGEFRYDSSQQVILWDVEDIKIPVAIFCSLTSLVVFGDEHSVTYDHVEREVVAKAQMIVPLNRWKFDFLGPLFASCILSGSARVEFVKSNDHTKQNGEYQQRIQPYQTKQRIPTANTTQAIMYTSLQKNMHREAIVQTALNVQGIILYTEGPDAGCTQYLIERGVSPQRLRPVNDEKKHAGACEAIEKKTNVHCLKKDISDALALYDRCSFIWLDMECTTIPLECWEMGADHLNVNGVLAVTLSVRGVPGGCSGQAQYVKARFKSCNLHTITVSEYRGRADHLIDMVHGLAQKREERAGGDCENLVDDVPVCHERDEDSRPCKRTCVQSDFHDRVLCLPDGIDDVATPLIVVAKREEAIKHKFEQYFLYNFKGERAVPCSTPLFTDKCRHRHGFRCHYVSDRKEADFRRRMKVPSILTARCVRHKPKLSPPTRSVPRRPPQILQPFLMYSGNSSNAPKETHLWLVTRKWSKTEYVVRPLLDRDSIVLGPDSAWKPTIESATANRLLTLKRTSPWDRLSEVVQRNKESIRRYFDST